MSGIKRIDLNFQKQFLAKLCFIRIATLLITLIGPRAYLLADVYKFPDVKWHASSEVGAQTFDISLLDRSSGFSLDYTPNVGPTFRPNIVYDDWLSISWTFNIPVSKEQTESFGQTRFNDFRFGFTKRSFHIEFNYSKFSGFYLENTSNYFPGAVGALLRPDLYSRSLGLSFTWIQNSDDFSLAALVNQNERQESWSGSWLLGASFSDDKISNNDDLIPITAKQDFSPLLNSLTAAEFTTLAVKGGYGYTMGGRWFIGGTIQIGPGLSQQRLRTHTSRTKESGFRASFRTELQLAGGFNGDTFFATLYSTNYQEVFFLDDSRSQIQTSLISGGLKIGTHLNIL